MQIAGTAIPHMTSNQFEKYCEKVRNELWDEAKITSAVNQACQVLDVVLLGNYDRDIAFLKPERYTNSLETQARSQSLVPHPARKRYKAKDSTIQDQAKTTIQTQQNSPSN